MKIKTLIIFCLIALMLVSCQSGGGSTETAPVTSATEETLADSEPSSLPAETDPPVVMKDPELPEPLDDDSVSGFGASSILTFKNLAIERAVQQIAFYEESGSLYILTTQRKGSTAYITRTCVNKSIKTSSKHAIYKLEGYGHAESMDTSRYNGQLYVFITSKANTVDSYSWGTEITRLKIEKGAITEEKTLTGLECITLDGSPMFEGATPHRVNFGMDDDADVMAVYTRASLDGGTSSKKQMITTYKLSDIHAALDASDSPVSFASLSSSATATMEAAKTSEICENGSFQGLDVDAEGRIFVSGGVTDKKPQIYEFKVENGVIKRISTKDVEYIISAALGVKNFNTSSEYVEIESIKYYKGEFYCVFNPDGGIEQDFTEVYVLKNK